MTKTDNLCKRCKCGAPCAHPWHYEFIENRERYRGATGTPDVDLARKIMLKARGDVIAGNAGVGRKITYPMLSDWIATYLKGQAVEFPKVVERDTLVLARFLEVLGDKPIDKVGRFEVERWRSARLKVTARSTVERDEHTIRGLLNDAAARFAGLTSPFEGRDRLKPLKLDQKPPRVLDAEEIGTALRGLPEDLALMFRLTLECLPRISECLKLRRPDLGRTTIAFVRKGGKQDRIQVRPELLAELRAHMGDREYVFGPDPTAEERRDLQRWHAKKRQGGRSIRYTRAFRALGLRGVSHHTARHTGATMMLEAGVNPREVQRLGGWSSLRMLQLYGHVNDRSQARAVAAQGAAIQAMIDAAPPPEVAATGKG